MKTNQMKIIIPRYEICAQTHDFAFRKLTNDDGVYFALNLQGGVITTEDVRHLFKLRLLDHQVVFLLKVFLQQ